MLSIEKLTQFSTKELKRRLNLHHVSLWIVWLGGGFAFGVGLAKMEAGDPLVSQMLTMSGLALLASIPVYKQKLRIQSVLKQR